MVTNRYIWLIISLVFSINSYAISSIYADQESGIAKTAKSAEIREDYFQNDVGVLIEEDEIKELRQSYISPYNYLQDPIDLDMGQSQLASESTGEYRLGTSAIVGMNTPLTGQNKAINTNIFQIWGQTGRYNGFALGGGGTALLNFSQIGQPNTFAATSVFAPVQAYLDYQYSNKFDIVAGNILITTPWVSSFGSNPGASYAMGNNSYQGVLVNVQALKSLLITAFTAWNYLYYPNNWGTQQTYYNTSKGVLVNIGNTPTSGPTGLGLIWNPAADYSSQLWFYNFADYANMAYTDNKYHLAISDLFSLDFAIQGFIQSSSGNAITNQTSLPGQNTPAGAVASNGIGGKIAVNIGNNTTSIAYNNIFGRSGSFLNGGMVTPYTYGMEIDPLYTTPALTSLAELGSGYAYSVRNSTAFLNNNLKFNLSLSQFFVNQVYASQPGQVTEYDAGLIYRIPHSSMNIWTRMVYVDQPVNAGGSMWQPRVIFNWTL